LVFNEINGTTQSSSIRATTPGKETVYYHQKLVPPVFRPVIQEINSVAG